MMHCIRTSQQPAFMNNTAFMSAQKQVGLLNGQWTEESEESEDSSPGEDNSKPSESNQGETHLQNGRKPTSNTAHGLLPKHPDTTKNVREHAGIGEASAVVHRHAGQLRHHVRPLITAHIRPPPERHVLLQSHAVQRQQLDSIRDRRPLLLPGHNNLNYTSSHIRYNPRGGGGSLETFRHGQRDWVCRSTATKNRRQAHIFHLKVGVSSTCFNARTTHTRRGSHPKKIIGETRHEQMTSNPRTKLELNNTQISCKNFYRRRQCRSLCSESAAVRSNAQTKGRPPTNTGIGYIPGSHNNYQITP